MLAYLSKFEPKLNQVGTKLAQDGSKLDPRWFHVGSSWVHVRPKLAPSWFKLSPSVPQRRSRRAWRFSYTLLGGSWKSPGGHQEPRAPKLFPKASESTKNGSFLGSIFGTFGSFWKQFWSSWLLMPPGRFPGPSQQRVGEPPGPTGTSLGHTWAQLEPTWA